MSKKKKASLSFNDKLALIQTITGVISVLIALAALIVAIIK